MLSLIGEDTSLSKPRKIKPKDYLYTVTPEVKDGFTGADSWEGQVNAIKKHVEKLIDTTGEKLSSKLDKLNERVAEGETREQAGEREIRGQVTRLKDNMQN